MGVLNVTPDSFSDGGVHLALAGGARPGPGARRRRAPTFSTSAANRPGPGADPVPLAEEIARVVPVIAALRADGFALPISIDTRNAAVARAAFDAGADLFNDVSALTHDPASLGARRRRRAVRSA